MQRGIRRDKTGLDWAWWDAGCTVQNHRARKEGLDRFNAVQWSGMSVTCFLHGLQD
ncbi:hypothetical protein CABS01_09952 [Colletotrichum abscissum]|uniref:uncharacterized protein n=1 Tax=Colletotrichum abscissum TaxID=1671311 RepID=UPI0027D5E7F8|nr:uncharacterized protein CABS01_09952 [Colletotrichum abscissum]KAK1500228.1 hypothetical protein CABS01_09952 [Colletotrichum abscissum]